MITIAITNQKGGVGKTTIAFNLAQGLASKHDTSVIALDNDPQGNLTSSFLEDPAKLNANILDVYNGETIEPMQISKRLYFIASNILLHLYLLYIHHPLVQEHSPFLHIWNQL